MTASAHPLKARAEITASIMSLVSIGADMMYAIAKSLRETEPIKGMSFFAAIRPERFRRNQAANAE
jgi:hypothetical protein